MKAEEIEKQIHDLVEQMYRAGFEYGVQYYTTEYSNGLYEKAQAYEKGLNDAWECARKIADPVNEGGFTYDELKRMFGVCLLPSIISKYSASEVITKIKEFEGKEQV